MAKIERSPFMSDLSALADKMDLRPLYGKNILVTGATGMIGNAVVCLLLANTDADIHVYAAGRSRRRLELVYDDLAKDPRLHLIELDVTRVVDSEEIFHYMIDCASLGNPAAFRDHPVDVMLANVVGVNNLLSYGMHHGLEKMVYVSSGEVYGEGDGRVFDECYCGKVGLSEARACYPQSKRAAEVLCISYVSQYGMDVSIVRPCHVYGPNFTDSDDRAFAQFLRNVVNGEDILLKSPGLQIRSWLYVADCAAAMLHILMNGSSGEAYNIAPSECSVSIREFASVIADAGGGKLVFDIPDGIDRNAIITKGVLDASKINAIGWHDCFTLNEGVKRSLAELTFRQGILGNTDKK